MSTFNIQNPDDEFSDSAASDGNAVNPQRISSRAVCSVFSDCSDFQSRRIAPGLRESETLFVCWLDGLTDGSAVAEEIIKPLAAFLSSGQAASPDTLLRGGVFSSSAELCSNTGTLTDNMLHAHCAVVFDSLAEAVTFEVRSSKQRSIAEPIMEKALKGARDSFVELLRTNTALVRQRLCTPELKTLPLTVGRRSHTRLCVLYVDGIADTELITELMRRLKRIDIDGLLTTGALEQSIADMPRSPFPQIIHTERPDRFARQLLNGRVGILVDGLPLGFLVPVSLREFMRVIQDDVQNFAVASLLSVIRRLAFFLALTLPALYVAVAMFHQEMIPTKLLLSIVASKQDVPFSTAFEVIGMLIAFELLQEAGLHLPDPIGDTVSIIGALIVGQSAVEAKVVSPIAVIVVALSAVAGLAQPSQDMNAALRLCRFVLVLSAIGAGLFGVAAALCLIVWHLCSIESFGRSYTAPLSGGRRHALARSLFIPPQPEDNFREPELRTADRRKQR